MAFMQKRFGLCHDDSANACPVDRPIRIKRYEKPHRVEQPEHSTIAFLRGHSCNIEERVKFKRTPIRTLQQAARFPHSPFFLSSTSRDCPTSCFKMGGFSLLLSQRTNQRLSAQPYFIVGRSLYLPRIVLILPCPLPTYRKLRGSGTLLDVGTMQLTGNIDRTNRYSI